MVMEKMKDMGVLMGKGGLHGNCFRIKCAPCFLPPSVSAIAAAAGGRDSQSEEQLAQLLLLHQYPPLFLCLPFGIGIAQSIRLRCPTHARQKFPTGCKG